MNYIYLEPDDIREFHLAALDRYGGVYGEHEPGMIDYMAEKPSAEVFGQECYPGLFLKAAVYLEGFATHQYFSDGNKRSGVLCVFVFLELNGYELDADHSELYEIALDAANERIELANIAEWIKMNSKPINC